MAALGRDAREAADALARAPEKAKTAALLAAAAAIRANAAEILSANEQDVGEAKQQPEITKAFLDRLQLDESRVEAMAASLEAIAALDDPIGDVLAEWTRPNGLRIRRVRVPLGVIGVIFEARPNVTADAAGLCLKAGNAILLRPGSECFHSAIAILKALQHGLKRADLPAAAIQIVPTRDRAAVGEMLRMTETIDVIVPRGGKSLIERVVRESRIPVFRHLDGICHVFIDRGADLAKARAIAVNAKMRRPGICGAMETLLIDATVAERFLPPILDDLAKAGCTIRGDEKTRALYPAALVATEADWTTEYLDAILSVRVVDDVDAAIAHINHYGSQHTDSIVTEDRAAAAKFLDRVDSAIVMQNTSTQFADGGEFGMGAEIGIATGRLHARGPVGVEQLTTYKYHVLGDGQVRP
ncbi:MAG: glutamate-5-semialdehyde dehydrogenase [Rhodospirillaceae bacterium]|nr:MAG: glutamate-5-semialdehyde dehydrogenase [Rhodospirillaceae bacterium]